MSNRCVRTVLAVLVGLAAGCSADSDPDGALRVAVPNEVIGDLVRRVACTEDGLEVDVEPLDTDGGTVAIRLTLEPPEIGEPRHGEEPLVLVLTDAVTTIERADGGAEPMFWLDPTRVAELTSAIGGALVVGAGLDGSHVDRCISRVTGELEQLDVDIAEQLGGLDDANRAIDVTVPGAVYFATRYDFAPATSNQATRASEMLTAGDLNGAASYDEMMRGRVGRLVEMLQRP